MIIKKIKPILIIALIIICCAFTNKEDSIDVKLIQNKNKEVRAQILSFDQQGNHYESLKNIKLVGIITTNKDFVDIIWDKIELKNKKTLIEYPFTSKVKVINHLETGDEFSAKGDYSSLISAIEDILQEQQKAKTKINSQGSLNNDSLYSYQSGSQPLSAYQDNVLDKTTILAEQGEEITITDGCSPYVDYELNTVFIQQRIVRDGEELQSCHHSSNSFILRKDYDSCPDQQDQIYFQYYYINNINNLDQRFNIGQCNLDETRSTATEPEEITTTNGCSPYVDYELNTVFIQQRILRDGQQIQGCHHSSNSFILRKDYDSCPDQQDLENRINKVYFQYHYIDDTNGIDQRLDIGECELDDSRSGNLIVTRNYENCINYTDLSLMKLYKQHQEYYTDTDNNQILLNDCQKDYEQSFDLIENFGICSLQHNFEKNFSISQKEIGYYDSQNQYIKLYDCMEDENYKYEHLTTTDTCSPAVTSNEVQIFSRKYISINGISQYISECTPSDNITIQEEICYQNLFTHDFETNQSYRNKNYFYYDNQGQKVIISNCIKSEEAFNHQEETSVCNPKENDNQKQTTFFSKTFIDINGTREYIGECKKMIPSVPYKNIGYKWINEFTATSSTITVTNSGDNRYIGSEQGEEISMSSYDSRYIDSWATRLVNQYNINNYSTANKCDSWKTPSYNGVAIDQSYSSLNEVTLDNYLSSVSSNPACYNSCLWTPAGGGNYHCRTQKGRKCQSTSNTLYYQRCTNHKCSLTKIVKFPIYQRSNNTHFTDESVNLEIKYICGNSYILNNVEVFYD